MNKAAGLAISALLVAGCASSGDGDTTTTTTTTEATTTTTEATTTTATVPTTTTAAPVEQRPLPNVVGLDLQLAQDTLQAAGFYALTSHDAKGLNRLQVLDRAWTVVDQSPPADTVVPVDQVIDLGAVRDEEYGQ